MGGWRILSLEVLVGLLYGFAQLLRRRPVLVNGLGALSFHLAWMALVLADAAAHPDAIPRLGGPLVFGAIPAALLFTFRETWLLVGSGSERSLDLLAESCARHGVPAVLDAGRLVQKRHGAAAERIRLLPGVEAVRFDCRRKEEAVLRVQQSWSRTVREAGRERRG